MPAGIAVPADQTLEGGAQLRITPAGFDKISQLIPAAIGDLLGDGTCVPEGGVLNVDYCYENDGSCTNGCQVDFTMDPGFPALSVVNNVLDIDIQFDIHADVPLEFDLLFGTTSCDMTATMNNARIDVDISVGIDAATGELDINVEDIPDLQLNVNLSGCSIVSTVLEALLDAFDAIIGIDFIRDLLQPLIEDLVLGLLPDPLGIEGMVNIGALLGADSAPLEMRMVPGGYAFLENAGMSLGMITGLNADEDQSTRGALLDSEPNLCSPPFAAPDFGAAPANLTQSPRGNFNLLPAGEFRGAPDPANTDVILGASETFLDLLGHHLVTSGGMCLGIGTETIDQLNLGTIGLLVPSLAELGGEDGTDPILLVTRPQNTLDFSIGEGTEEDPSITIHVKNLEVDFYAFIFERYVRGFTLSLSLDAGINLEYTVDADGNPAIIPTLVGLESDMIGIEVLNEEFLREDRATLEAVLPTIFDLALPLLSGGFDPIALPDLAGFTLSDLTTTKVTTSEDDFIAIGGALTPSTSMAVLGQHFPSIGAMYAREKQPAPVAASGTARLAEVSVPSPAVIRAGLRGIDGGKTPSVTIDVDSHDALGRPLEWSWNVSGGIWRPYETANPLVIRDHGLAVQGEHSVQLRSRVVGDYTTTSQTIIELPFVIDSAGPRIHGHRATVENGIVTVPATDLVSPASAIEFAFAKVGAQEPATTWGNGTIAAADLARYADASGHVRVFARDERGNMSNEDEDLGPVLGFHGSADDGGCNCDATGDSRGAAGAMFVLGLLWFAFRRRRRGDRAAATGISHLAIVLVAVASMALPACSCGGDGSAIACEINEDCVEACADGTVPICFEGECLCADDVPYGKIGQYSELAPAPDGSVWVSGYNSTYGDLMVANHSEGGRIPNEAWQFVDGVPSGPVIVEGSTIRGGIFEVGEDVGQNTSIAVNSTGDVFVAYYDVDRAALKMASNTGGEWRTHDIDVGAVSADPEQNFSFVGLYTAMTMTRDDRPGVAYFVTLNDGGEYRTEVRFAQSSMANPGGASDWRIDVAEATIIPPPDPDNPDFLTIPQGSGLFVDAALDSNDAVRLVYYDRTAGALKLTSYNSGAAMFDPAVILDGDGTAADVGWYPSIAIDDADVAHVSYVSASKDDLLYINTADMVAEVVDDGYRIVGQTPDGLPKPEFHFVGDDSSMVMSNIGPVIVYQDATSHELLWAQQDVNGNWQFDRQAGLDDPFAGAYGFYASAAMNGEDLVMSTWVLDQPASDAWVEIFARRLQVD